VDKNKGEGFALERISRRRALKRVAAGAAVAWSAPVLTSLSTPASATHGYTACAGHSFSCGNPSSFVDCGLGCFCLREQCVGDFGCGTTPTCTTDAECTAQGYLFCQGPGEGCCGAGVCIPDCTTDAPAAPKGAATNSGR